MHSFLKSVGYSQIKDQAEIEKLIYKSIAEADTKKRYVRENGTAILEYKRNTTEDTGIIVRGEEDAEGKFHFSHYFPFGNGTCDISKEDEIYINKRVDTNAYTGMCDDSRLGISLIFYVNNVIEYFADFDGVKCIESKGVIFTALAESGKIILPTLVHTVDSDRQKRENNKKNHLIAEAKKGNQEAIESLTIEDIDRYAMVSQRIRNEDILSIVETSIVPYGSESDMYKITGNISCCKRLINKDTGENIWMLEVICNEIPIDVYINAEDLLGEPKVGRRFRGNIWLQGILVDPEE